MTITEVRPARGRERQPDAYSAPGLTLRGAAAIFASTFSARVLTPLTLAAIVARLALAGWSWWDLVAAGAILGLQPFTEWVIHVTFLHWKPRTIGRVVLDPLGARRHRQHHRDPKVIGLVLVPRQILVTTTLLAIPIYLLALPSIGLGLTAVATSYAMYLLYEWTHFLIHSSYRPRGRYYRYIWRAHRLHHFRNENYWFGVTVHLADHVLRTFPGKDDVPVSPTAATLGVT
ncbi:MAG TPA: sterol desaturase family protein [Mycobacteriales bacterium]|nr:sterol desaturase family protein [Mycobacteriales bacterium]